MALRTKKRSTPSHDDVNRRIEELEDSPQFDDMGDFNHRLAQNDSYDEDGSNDEYDEDQSDQIDWQDTENDTNPVDDYYKRRFGTAKDLNDAERNSATGGSDIGDDIAGGENTPADTGRDPVSPSGKRGGKGKLRKLMGMGAGPSGVIVLLLAIFGGSSVILGPASLLVNLHEIGTNHTNLGQNIYQKMGNSYIGAFFAGQNRDCSKSKIKCTFTRITEKQKARMEARGVSVKTEPSRIPGLLKMQRMDFPNGRSVTTRSQYNNLKYIDIQAYSLTKRFPALSYVNPKSAFRFATQKFGIYVGNKWRSAKTEDKNQRKAANKESLNNHTGAANTKDANDTRIKNEGRKRVNTATGRISSKATSFKNSLTTAGGIGALGSCITYDLVRAARGAVMLYWHKELLGFAMPFLQAGSMIKEGDIDWETVEQFGDRLTAPVTEQDVQDRPDLYNESMIGKTAMDSKAFGAALRGDHQTIEGTYAEKYASWNPARAVIGGGMIDAIQETVPGGKDSIKYACQALTYTMVAAARTCFKGGVSALVCLASGLVEYVAGKYLAPPAIEFLVNQLSEPAMEAIAAAGLDADLHGPPLGEAVISAAGVAGNYMDRASGFPVASTRDQAKQAFIDTYTDDDFIQDQIATGRLEAEKNQFDVTNQYSFAGQFVSRFAATPLDGSLFSVVSNMANVVSANTVYRSTASATKNGIYQPIEIYGSQEKIEETLDNCADPALQEGSGINVPGLGESCHTVPVVLPTVRDCLEDEDDPNSDRICILEAIDHLSNDFTYFDGSEEKPYIDGDTGKPSDWDQYNKSSPNQGENYEEKDYKNPFLMYMQYCGRDRKYPPGYTDKSITLSFLEAQDILEESSIDVAEQVQNLLQPYDDWHDFTNCAVGNWDEEELAWMSYYYTACMGIHAGEEGLDYCWEEAPVAVAGSSDGWVYPICDATLSSPYGPREGGFHRGMDFAAPTGTPIYAAHKGTVVKAGPASGFGNWIVIQHEVDGKRYDTVYGHMFSDGVLVSVGDTVNAGDQIGEVGNAGTSSGPHLHFEIWDGGRDSGNAIDPAPILDTAERTCGDQPTTAQQDNAVCVGDSSTAPDKTDILNQLVETCQQMYERVDQAFGPFVKEPPITIAIDPSIERSLGYPSEGRIRMANPGFDGATVETYWKPTLIHEMMHLTQNYISTAHQWITEGIAEYGRVKLGFTSPNYPVSCAYEPYKRYTVNGGYLCANALFRYIEKQYDSQFVDKLHDAEGNGTYSDAFFIDRTGKDVETLYAECLSFECAGGNP
tara:strand:+ start:19028 stop:22858 length:3831 start_codon:yes stop_codon:yes gene_type:complete